MNYIRKSELTNPVKRNLKEKEKYLDRRCTSIWTFTNPEGIEYMFSRFCRKWDKLIVTLAYYHKGIGWIPVR
jgi:hypothetical protein